MGEIIFGIIVVVIFLAFVMKKGKAGDKRTDQQKINEAQYWADKNAQKAKVVSANDDSNDNNDDTDSNDD